MRTRPATVLHIARSLGLGGTEKVLQLLVTHLDRERYQPAVFAFSDGERGPLIRAAGVPTHISRDLDACLDLLDPDIVHLHRAGWPDPQLTRPLKRRRRRLRGRPAVVETNVFGRHDPSTDAVAIDRHLFVSHFCLRRYTRMHCKDAAPPRHDVLYNPVDTDFLQSRCPERSLAAPVIGRLSRPDPGKWSSLALDILPILARDVPGFLCRIVGATDQARAFVDGHGLRRSVVYEDPLLDEEALARFLGGISLLAHANDTGESFGLAIAEAMAAGLPVVTHPCSDLRDNAQLELVEHGVTGLIAATAPEYAAAVAWLLRHPDEARDMGQAGRDKARQLFRVQEIARRVQDVYDGLDLDTRKAENWE